MVTVDLVRAKVARLRNTAAALRGSMRTPAGLRASRDALDLVAFRFYLVVQEAVDLSSHVVSDQGWGPLPTLREHFSVLRDKGVLPGPVADALAAAIKIRNLIGHAYVDIDPDKLHAAAEALDPLIEPFCASVLTYAESHAQ
jgi:uncharacterized protein YutE (UPF0331/DUF86 family)